MSLETNAILREIDDDLLDQLVAVAVNDASADEVTPPLTPGDTWSTERIEWFVDYHRSCRAGLSGPSGESTWAIVSGGDCLGCVRLKRTSRAEVLEAGIWIRRAARRSGVGLSAMTALLDKARSAGATAVYAETTAENRASQSLLRSAGFTLTMPGGRDGSDGAVEAVMALDRSGRPR
ncbi:MAG: GNAT family N-acetyltransferase [Actinomycetota bacterium]